MRAQGLLPPLLVGLLFAGCLGGAGGLKQDPGASPMAAIPDDPIEQDHDHADPALHNLTVNLRMVAHDSSYGDGSASAIPAGEGFSELFVRDGLAFLGRRGGNDGGFVIYDVKDPAHPKRLGAFQGLANYDMESTYDNQFVVFVSQYLNNQQLGSVPPRGTGDVPRGIHLVSISDRKQPSEVVEAFVPVPTRGVHTITYYRTDAGRELVVAQTYDFLPDPSLGLPVPGEGANPVSQRVLLFDFLRGPVPHLQLLSVFEKHPVPPLGGFFPHDVSIQKHPVTGRLLLYVAYWNLGAFLVDITDPANPKEISNLNDFAPSKLANIHLAAPSPDLIAGRHVTITEPELGGGEGESGQYTLFDTTDPAHPVRLGHWTLPGEIKNDIGTRFSPHNFEVENGLLVLAHYHAGIWVLDIHDESHLQQPVALALAQPNLPRPGYKGDAPDVWTALWDGGLIYASDIATGLYVYEYVGGSLAAPVPAA